MTPSRAKAAGRGGPVVVGGVSVAAGRRKRLELPVARLPTGTWLSLPVSVINGRGDGPMMWLSSTIHGDELNGIEIIRRVMESLDARAFNGAVIAVPIVNVFGFIDASRYLPDRRDLNRSFPGSARGSLASRLANLFIREIARPCAYGIDFHTGSNHRTNLPQIRADLDDPETLRVAESFGAPVIVNSRTRDGSLREVAARDGTCVLLFEGGEPLRFDEETIEVGVQGTLRVMSLLGMRQDGDHQPHEPSVRSDSATWVRARRAGIVRLTVHLGDRVQEGDVLAIISDAFGEKSVRLRSPLDGIVIGLSRNPSTTQGDGVAHIAAIAD